MFEAINDSEENYSQGRPLVLGRLHNLHQGVQGHWSTTSPTSSCPRPNCHGIKLLSDHPARLQRHTGQRQETSLHILRFPCRVLSGKGYFSSQTRRDKTTRIQVLDRRIPQARSKGPCLTTCFIGVILLAICSQ
jgi:hypothetical protein